MPSSHTIHRHHHHFGWDNANPPALVVAPGDTVEFETVDSSGAQLSPTSTWPTSARSTSARSTR